MSEELAKEQKDALVKEVSALVMNSVNDKTTEIKNLFTEMKDNIKLFEDKRLTKAEFEERDKKIQARMDELEKAVKRPILNAADEKKEKSPEMKAFSSYLKKGTLTPEEQKVLTISDDTGVGYLAPKEYVAEIIKGVAEISPIRSLASVVSTDKNSRQSPKETGTFDAGWVAEIGTRTETTGLKFGLEEIPVHEMYALVKISQQALEDSAFNLEAYLQEKIVERFAYLEGVAEVSGNAVGKPEGFLTNAAVDATTVVYDVSDGAILINGMIDLIVSKLKSAYSRVGTLVANRGTIAYLRKAKDASNRYYWEPSFQAGTPGVFLGVPIVEVPDMPALTTAGYKGMAFGDWKRGYLIVDRIGMSVQRLVEKYAEYGQVGFMARRRVGGQVVLAEALAIGISQA